jgi:hypothetical protein
MHNEEMQILVWGRSPSSPRIGFDEVHLSWLTFERHKGVLGYFAQLPAAHALERGHDPTGRHEQSRRSASTPTIVDAAGIVPCG